MIAVVAAHALLGMLVILFLTVVVKTTTGSRWSDSIATVLLVLGIAAILGILVYLIGLSIEVVGEYWRHAT